jgi:predicted nucleic acid-binding protein
MPAVVSDSSPLVYLTRLGRFDLLRVLYQQVLVPPAVWREVAVEGAGLAEAESVKQAVTDGWLVVEKVPEEKVEPSLSELGDGERDAILLARAKNAMLIIDETDGRNIAARLGVRCTGRLGVLVEAKLRSLIPRLRPELNKLKAETNFRFTEELFAEALTKVGETNSSSK